MPGDTDATGWTLDGSHVAVTALLGALVVGVLLVGFVGSAGAAAPTATPTPTATPNLSERAPYPDATGTPDQRQYLDGQSTATLEAILGLAARFGGLILGTPEGGTVVGTALMVGLVVAGMAVAALAQPSAGIVAGGIAALVLLWGLTASGFAPLWLYAVGLVLLGLVASAALIRVVR